MYLQTISILINEQSTETQMLDRSQLWDLQNNGLYNFRKRFIRY